MGGEDEIAIFATNITLKLVDSIKIIATMCFTYLVEHPTHVISAARRITVDIVLTLSTITTSTMTIHDWSGV